MLGEESGHGRKPTPRHRGQAYRKPSYTLKRCTYFSGRTQGHSGGRRVVVDPEGYPGQDGNQDGGHVCLQDEVANVPLQFEAEGQTGVRT